MSTATNTLQPTFTAHPPVAQPHAPQMKTNFNTPAHPAANSHNNFAFNQENFPKSSPKRFDADSASEDNSSYGKKGHSRGGFNWELLFFRLSKLNDVVQALEDVLNNGN